MRPHRFEQAHGAASATLDRMDGTKHTEPEFVGASEDLRRRLYAHAVGLALEVGRVSDQAPVWSQRAEVSDLSYRLVVIERLLLEVRNLTRRDGWPVKAGDCG